MLWARPCLALTWPFGATLAQYAQSMTVWSWTEAQAAVELGLVVFIIFLSHCLELMVRNDCAAFVTSTLPVLWRTLLRVHVCISDALGCLVSRGRAYVAYSPVGSP